MVTLCYGCGHAPGAGLWRWRASPAQAVVKDYAADNVYCATSVVLLAKPATQYAR